MKTLVAVCAGILVASSTAFASELLTSVPNSSRTVTDWYKQNVYDPNNNKIGEMTFSWNRAVKSTQRSLGSVSKVLGSGADTTGAEKADRFGFPPDAGERVETAACAGGGLEGVGLATSRGSSACASGAAFHPSRRRVLRTAGALMPNCRAISWCEQP